MHIAEEHETQRHPIPIRNRNIPLEPRRGDASFAVSTDPLLRPFAFLLADYSPPFHFSIRPIQMPPPLLALFFGSISYAYILQIYLVSRASPMKKAPFRPLARDGKNKGNARSGGMRLWWLSISWFDERYFDSANT